MQRLIRSACKITAEDIGREQYIREYFRCFAAACVPHLQRMIRIFGSPITQYCILLTDMRD